MTRRSRDSLRTCFILGAGATRGASRPWTMPGPPLVKGFVRDCSRLRRGFRDEAALSAGARLAGVDVDDDMDVEELVEGLGAVDEVDAKVVESARAELLGALDRCSRISSASYNLPDKEHIRTASTQDLARWCTYLFRIAVFRVFYEMLTSSPSRAEGAWDRWVCADHQELANRMHDGERVVSFNYDVVFDCGAMAVLRERRGEDRDWDHVCPDLYGWSDGGDARLHPGAAALIKPHGSINWVGLTDVVNAGVRWNGLVAYDPNTWNGHPSISPPRPDEWWEPLVALPHESRFAESSTESIWPGCEAHPFDFLRREMIAAVADAEYCVAIGYRFADEHDPVGRELVERLAARNIEVGLVNPQKGLARELRRSRGLRAKRLACDLPAFLRRWRRPRAPA